MLGLAFQLKQCLYVLFKGTFLNNINDEKGLAIKSPLITEIGGIEYYIIS